VSIGFLEAPFINQKYTEVIKLSLELETFKVNKNSFAQKMTEAIIYESTNQIKYDHKKPVLVMAKDMFKIGGIKLSEKMTLQVLVNNPTNAEAKNLLKWIQKNQ